MRFDYLDLIYSERQPEGLSVPEVVASVSELIASGKVRAWGVLNWSPEQIAEAARGAAAEGVLSPCAAQLPYSLAYRQFVEDVAMGDALDAARANVIASAVLAGGALTGKYGAGASGRLSNEHEDQRRRRAFEVGERLRTLAERMGTTPARLAIAFAVANPQVASVLFGATSPEQVVDNVGALDVVGRMSEAELAELRSVGVSGTE